MKAPSEVELELRENAQRMNEAQQIAGFGNWEWVVAENAVTWSNQLYRIFGLDPAEFDATFEAYIERVHPDDREQAGKAIQAALEKRTAYVGEHRIVRPDGSERMLRCHGQPVLDDEGEVARLVGVCQDITELSEAERARRAAEARFRNAFEHAPIGVALADLEDGGRFLAVNHALEAISGRSREDLLATSLDELTIADDRRADSSQRASLVDGAVASYKTERRLLHADGHQVWTEISLSMAQDTGASPYAIAQIQDISERRRFEHRLHYLANHDALTGLANRRHFLTELERQVTHNARYGGRGAVLMLDVDRFKLVNDRLGHQAGDNLLRRVASLLRDRVRTSDAVARFAGDEFAVLMPQTNPDGAVHLGQDLRRELKARLGAESGPGKVTVSVGITIFNGDEGGEIDAVLAAADSAMYRAKEGGRDRVELMEDGTDGSPGGHGLSNPALLREALTAEGLVLHSQPIIDLNTDREVRRELLVRLPDGSGKHLAASSFIGTAEQFGMVQELDRWVIGRAIALLARQQRNDSDASIHVNLSGASLTDASVLEFIERELDTGDAIGTGITFEITETAAVHNFDTASEFADRLTEFGCSVAIDDFGAGFGPFYYLKHLPFDVIKIDGEFVRDLPRSDADRLTVEAIVKIAHGLGKETIAEFVEEAGTVDILRELGVDMAQGYFLGRPEPIANGS